MSGYHDGDRTFYIGDVDAGLEKLLIPLTTAVRKQISLREGDGLLNLFVNSYGGYAHIGLHIVELMEIAKREGVTVRTMVTSAAYSAGSIIAVAGTPGERYISRTAEHMIHLGNAGSPEEMTPEEEEVNKVRAKVFYRQVSKHYEQYCHIPDLKKKVTHAPWYIVGPEAKRLGLADHYIDKLQLV